MGGGGGGILKVLDKKIQLLKDWIADSEKVLVFYWVFLVPEKWTTEWVGDTTPQKAR